MALFITILAQVQAREVVDVRIEDTINDEILTETIRFHITGNYEREFLFSPPKEAYGISSSQNFTVRTEGIILDLTCTDCEFSITYSLSDVLKRDKSGSLEFSRTLAFPVTPPVLGYTIHIPHRYLLERGDAEPPIVPEPKKLSTDGRMMTISWEEESPTLPKRYHIRLHDQQKVTYIWAAIPLLITSIALGFMARRSPEATSCPIPSSLLGPDEKVIIKELEKHNRVYGQKQIGKDLGWSKSKVSAVLSNLEYKKIISREKVGRNYTVTLIEKIGD